MSKGPGVDFVDWWAKPRNVSVVVDTPRWYDPYGQMLVERISAGGDQARFVREHADVMEGGVAFYLSCYKITPPEILARNHHNVVIHTSALPQGRGFSPIVHQVREGKNRIPFSMIFAADEVDTGDIIMQSDLVLEGHELHDEFRARMGEKVNDMVMAYLALPEPPTGIPQSGDPSWYPKIKPEMSRLDPGRTIAEQFDLLRSCDNQNFPAFFEYRGKRYELRITKS